MEDRNSFFQHTRIAYKLKIFLVNHHHNNRLLKGVLKYKDLLIEIQRVWIVKARMILISNGATASLSKSFQQHLDDISSKTSS
jgi:hypothetical protein